MKPAVDTKLEARQKVDRAPFTFGQLSLWRSIQGLPPQACNLPEIWPLPPSATVASVERALEDLEKRHESLRSTYGDDAERGLTQTVWEPAAISLEVVEAGDDPSSGATAVAERLPASPFDLAVDRAWRACLITSNGAPSRLVVCFHHMAVDAWAMNQLKKELLLLLSGGSLVGEAPNCRDLAAEQWSAARGNRRKAAREYWRDIFQVAPDMEKEAGTALSTRWATLSSDTAADAANSLAVRLRLSAPSVVLAAFGLALGRRTGRDKLMIAVYTNNRSNPRWQTLVASQNQIVPLLLTVDPAEPFDSVVQRTHWDLIGAYRHGAYNVDDMVQLGRQYGYSGSVNGSFEGSVLGFFRYFFNYLGPYDKEKTYPKTEMQTGTTGRNIGAPLYLQVQDGRTLSCTLRENSSSPNDVAAILRLLEDIILAAAEQPADRDLPAAESP